MRFPPLLILIGIMSGVDAAAQGALTETELTSAAARIDEVVLRTREKEIQSAQRWQRAESKVPPRATDQAFLRRACIDLAGRLPLATEVRAFLVDASEDKRQRLIDQLVLEPTAAEARFRRLAEALRVTDTVGKTSQAPFIAWLRAAMVEDMPYDQLMAVMLRASGDVSQEPAAGLLQRDEGDILHTSTELARAFLGADLHCAQCHDHPYNDYTQRGCYEFAACFAGAPKPSVNAAKTAVKPKTLFPGAIPFGRGAGQQQAVAVGSNRGGLTLPPSYLYRDGKPGEVVQPRYLLLDDLPGDGPRSAFTASPSPGAKLREQVALWFTGPQNERFAAVGAWRVWNHLFGSLSPFGARREGEAGAEAYHSVIQRRGCDMPPSWNPVSWNDWLFDRKSASAEAVSALGIEFKRCGYRIREFQRILARTQAYQAEASAVRFPFGPGLIDAAPALRRLPPEVIWDAWVRWLPESDDIRCDC